MEGHKPQSGKGLDTLFKAMALVKGLLGPNTLVLKIHGHYGEGAPEYGLRITNETGIADNIRWLNQISNEAAQSEYQRSLLCVLPYTRSFAGLPAVNAMANGVPVIGTRLAGLPEHLGDAGIWVEANDAEGLAKAIVDLLNDEVRRRDVAAKGRARAEYPGFSRHPPKRLSLRAVLHPLSLLPRWPEAQPAPRYTVPGRSSSSIMPGRPSRSSMGQAVRSAQRRSSSPGWAPRTTPTPRPPGRSNSPTGSAPTCARSPSWVGSSRSSSPTILNRVSPGPDQGSISLLAPSSGEPPTPYVPRHTATLFLPIAPAGLDCSTGEETTILTAGGT